MPSEIFELRTEFDEVATRLFGAPDSQRYLNLGNVPELTPEEEIDTDRSNAQRIVGAIFDLARDWVTTTSQIKNNKSLTVHGQKGALGESAIRYRSKLAGIEEALFQTESELKRREEALRVQKPPANEVAHKLEVLDQRRDLRQRPVDAILRTLDDAIEAGESIAVEAILGMSLWQYPADADRAWFRERLQEAEQRWQEKQSPQLAAQVRRLRDVTEKARSALNALSNKVEREGAGDVR